MLFETSGFVYFIQAPINGLIKIGFSESHPEHRFKNLSTMIPVPLVRLGYILGSFERERQLHEQFKELRSHGEWFEPGLILITYISSQTLKWPIPTKHWQPPERKKMTREQRDKQHVERLNEEMIIMRRLREEDRAIWDARQRELDAFLKDRRSGNGSISI